MVPSLHSRLACYFWLSVGSGFIAIAALDPMAFMWSLLAMVLSAEGFDDTPTGQYIRDHTGSFPLEVPYYD